MTTEIVEWVSDIGEPTDRGVRYINVAFEGGETAFIGKKDYDDALYIQGLLIEAKGKPTEFTLEDTGKKNKKGLSKFKIKAVGEYQPQPFQGGGGGASVNSTPRSSRTPEQVEDIRWLACLKAAANARPGQPGDVVLDLALMFYQFDLRAVVGTPSPTAEGALSQPPGSAPTISASGEANTVADKPGTPSTSDADSSDGIVVGASDAESGVGTSGALEGEASTSCPPHDPDRTKEPKGMGRYPCRKCGAYVR